MTTKDYLNQAYRLNELIESNQRELTRLHELSRTLSGFDTTKVAVKGGSSGEATFTKTIEKIADLEQQINVEIDCYVDTVKELREFINAVPDKDERLLLRLRYIEFMRWEKIAEQMGYSTQWVYNLHSKALRNLKNNRVKKSIVD